MHKSEAPLPSRRNLIAEGPAIARLIARQFRSPPVAAQEPIETPPALVLPGFMTGDFHTRLLRQTIRACGGRAFAWGQGLNIGADPDKFTRLLERVDRLRSETGQRLALIGWSLGGLYARELAKRSPEHVAMVVTLGSAFSHGPGSNHGKPIYNLINDHHVDHPPFAPHPEAKPPVFTVACWSKQDGMVAPVSAAGELDEADVRVELDCRHHDMVTDPEAVRTIIALLRAGRGVAPPPSAEASKFPLAVERRAA